MDKEKIKIKSRLTGGILFEYEKKNNSIKDTLERAVKEKPNLEGADLEGAYLVGAYLVGANLKCTDLKYAILEGADLRYANLEGADLRHADLRYADLECANFRCADLKDANLAGTKNIPYIPLACPSDGEFTAWKKVKGKLVQLLIPADARRSSAASLKCRCDKAKVISITDIDGTMSVDSITSNIYTKTEYRVGEYVFPDSWDDDRWNECSHGIHFFINKQDAISY